MKQDAVHFSGAVIVRTYCHSTQGSGVVQYGRPRHISQGGERIGAEAECEVVIGSTGGDPCGSPCLSCKPLLAGDNNRGMADGASDDSK